MATKKNASKTSKKASLSLNWNSSEKSNKKNQKKAAKQIKKLSFKAVVAAIVFLVVGALVGFVGLKIVTVKDCFVLNGQDEITLQIGESYADEGAKVVAFGKDVGANTIIETNLQEKSDGTYYAEEEGTYYIIYKSTHFKYGSLFKIQKIRLITFVEATEPDELNREGGNQ